MAPGSQFLVPRGNDYCIENISPDKEAQLFFAQARKIRANEIDADGVSESQAGEAGLPSRKSISASQTQGGKKSNRLPSVREESRDISQSEREDEEEGEEEEEITVKKRRKSKGKSRR